MAGQRTLFSIRGSVGELFPRFVRDAQLRSLRRRGFVLRYLLTKQCLYL